MIYFIQNDAVNVGFAHLGSRGGKMDWLEDLFILPEWQGHGFGSEAIHQLEEIVKQYSVSLYIEAAARNEAAIRLYRKLGYDCLNTVTFAKTSRATSMMLCGRKISTAWSSRFGRIRTSDLNI